MHLSVSCAAVIICVHSASFPLQGAGKEAGIRARSSLNAGIFLKTVIGKLPCSGKMWTVITGIPDWMEKKRLDFLLCLKMWPGYLLCCVSGSPLHIRKISLTKYYT